MADLVVSKGLISIVESVTRAFAAHEAKEVRTLKHLADKKFREITSTHKLFMKLMNELIRAARDAQKSLSKPKVVLSALRSKIMTVERKRQVNRTERLAQYEEAWMYGDNILQDRGLLKKIPGDIAIDLQSFMVEYFEYFHSNNRYQHDLGHTIEAASGALEGFGKLSSIAKSHQARSREVEMDRGHLRMDLLKLVREIEANLASSDRRWRRVSSTYFRLQKSLLEHGYGER